MRKSDLRTCRSRATATTACGLAAHYRCNFIVVRPVFFCGVGIFHHLAPIFFSFVIVSHFGAQRYSVTTALLDVLWWSSSAVIVLSIFVFVQNRVLLSYCPVSFLLTPCVPNLTSMKAISISDPDSNRCYAPFCALGGSNLFLR